MADLPLKDRLLRNWALKLTALVLALVVWALLAGRERAFAERTMKVPIEVAGISSSLEVQAIRPEQVQLTIRGPALQLSELNADSLKVRVDLSAISEGQRLNIFVEDYLRLPQGFTMTTLHPRMVEIQLEEFATKELPVRVKLTGRLPAGLRLVETHVVPDRVSVFGYKSQLARVETVATVEIPLHEWTATATRRFSLQPGREILKFRDRGEVDVTLTLSGENTEK